MNLQTIAPALPAWFDAFLRGWWGNFTDEYKLRYHVTEDRIEYQFVDTEHVYEWHHLNHGTHRGYVTQAGNWGAPPPEARQIVEVLP